MRFISHELRTPLNSVFMGLQLSIDQIPEDVQEPVEVERRETLVETQSACGAALDILNELLLFDKLESGVLVLNKLNAPVPELVEDSIKMFSVQTREKSIELLITNNDESMLAAPLTINSMSIRSGALSPLDGVSNLFIYDTDEVTVDKNKVVQVIRNVVSNAIKFTPARGRIQINIKFVSGAQCVKKTRSGQGVALHRNKSRVIPTECNRPDLDIEMSLSMQSQASGRLGLASLSLKQVPGELVIEIKDNGAGISEENQRRLFKEVVQFNPELLQNGGGSGLGMCISKSIIDMHGGTICVVSGGEGQGSLFTLRLPMVRLVCDADSPRIYNPTPCQRKPSTRHPPLPRGVSFVANKSERMPSYVMAEDESNLSTEQDDPPHSPSPRLAVSSKSMKSSTSLKSLGSMESQRPLIFLVVDDSSLNRKMLCRLLQKQGHVCVEAEDGVQAVAVLTAALAARRDEEVETKRSELQDEESGRDEIGSEKGVVNTEFDMILMDFM